MSGVVIEDTLTLADIICKEKRGKYTQGICVTEYPVIITYQNQSMPDAEKNWHTPAVVLYSSDDGQVDVRGAALMGTDSVEKAEKAKEAEKYHSPSHYVEYSATRSDAYGIRSAAVDYQYESQRNPEWKSWKSWLAANKEGTACTVTAVRFGKYVMIRMENTGIVVSTITTLPEEAEDVYFALSGERCMMSRFKVIREKEAIEAGTIEPLVVQKPVMPEVSGDIPNLDCAGWWTAHTEGIEITEEPVRVTYDSISYSQAKENWHTPLVVVFSSLDKLVNGVLYEEYSVIRSDAYGWGVDGIGYSSKVIYPERWSSWKDWLKENKKGIHGSVTAFRNENTVVIRQNNHGVIVTSSIQVPAGRELPICLALSGELCAISNIRITR